jgi:aquaporin TIP
VTFSQVMTGRMRVSTGLLYVGGQVTGAVLAVLLLKGIVAGPMEAGLGAHGINVFNPDSGLGILDDQIGGGAGAGLLVEVVLTFALVFVVFATAVDPKGPGHLAPAAIGLVIMADHFIGIPLTGASMNPARSFGLGPLIGAGIAALVYEFIFLNREE